MTASKKQNEKLDKIIKGLEEVRYKIIKFKKDNNSVIVVMENGKIVKIKPE